MDDINIWSLIWGRILTKFIIRLFCFLAVSTVVQAVIDRYVTHPILRRIIMVAFWFIVSLFVVYLVLYIPVYFVCYVQHVSYVLMFGGNLFLD